MCYAVFLAIDHIVSWDMLEAAGRQRGKQGRSYVSVVAAQGLPVPGM